MIKAFIISALTLLGGVDAKDVKVDAKASKVEWVGKKVTGQHNGVIALTGGRLEMDDNGNLTGGLFTIDMKSIECLDLSGEYK
ncbi:MAG: YceI family protein, partial [Bacteroidota bacterium]